MKLILPSRKILSVYLLHRASSLDRFWRIANKRGKQSESKREINRKIEMKGERDSTWRMKNFTRLRVGRNLLVRRWLRNLLLVVPDLFTFRFPVQSIAHRYANNFGMKMILRVYRGEGISRIEYLIRAYFYTRAPRCFFR